MAAVAPLLHQRSRFLAGISEKESSRIVSLSEHVDLPRGTRIQEPGEPATHVFFPLAGVVSVVAVMRDGGTAEVGTIGDEGMVGLPVYFGSDTSPMKTFQQVAGQALRMPARRFLDEVKSMPELQKRLLLFSQAFMTQIAMSTACNRLHPVEERCARWLLMTRDRVHGNELALTQEFLAEMLGVRRPSVTTAAGALQRAGMIKYSHGKITVLDPALLEEASCECYGIVKAEYDRLLGNGN